MVQDIRAIGTRAKEGVVPFERHDPPAVSIAEDNSLWGDR
jgi:hypothetical protein